MAIVLRQDTGEFVGYLTEPEGPFPGGITYWPFKAWVHSDGKLRSEPEIGANDETPVVNLNITVRNNSSTEVHLIVPPELHRRPARDECSFPDSIVPADPFYEWKKQGVSIRSTSRHRIE